MGTKVRLNTIYANASGVAQPGDVIAVADAEAKDLIDGGYAAAVLAAPIVPRKSTKDLRREAAETELADARSAFADAEDKLSKADEAGKGEAQKDVDLARDAVAKAEAALDKLSK